MVRHSMLGSAIIVTNVAQTDYASLLDRLKPKYLECVEAATAKDNVRMPPDPLVYVLFLLRHDSGGTGLDASWAEDLPVSQEQFGDASSIIIAAKRTRVPGQKTPLVHMLIKAPTQRLLDVAVQQSLGLYEFPFRKPIIYETVDLRHVRAIACLPSVAEKYSAIGNAAEATLYRALIGLRAFRVVGREAMPIASAPSLMTTADVRRLGRDLNVQALAFARIRDAETICKEETRYKKSRKTSVSPEKQRAFDDLKRKLEKQGKRMKRKRPETDLVWAAPYQHREYATTVRGEIKVLDTANGQNLLTYEIEGSKKTEEQDTVRSSQYRWYKKDEIDKSWMRHEEEYGVRLRTPAAIEVARQQVATLGDFLSTRAILPVPGEALPDAPPVGEAGTAAKVLNVDGQDVYISLGRQQGLREGDTLSLWVDKALRDPDTGKTIETVRTRGAQIKVVELYEKTSRCEIVSESEDHRLGAGMTIVLD